MNHNIKYEPLNEIYVGEALEIVLSLYDEEKKSVPFLPSEEEFSSSLKDRITRLFKNGEGVVAIHNSRLIGFLSGFKVPELFGKCKGIYSPLYGHGVLKEYGSSVYKELYKRAADIWVKNSSMSHAITFFAHDTDTVNTWFWMGFGMRCVDSIRESSPIEVRNSSITIKKADVSDIPSLAEIHGKHIEYYRKTPIFMPTEDEDPIEDLTKWLQSDNHHLWIAYHNDKPLGYMRIQPDGESFISEHHKVMNITGAYVSQDERKSGVGAMLLDEIQEWLLENDYPLCGVDFESINTTGSSFWNKYFTPYTYSLVRRIDERIES